MQHSEIKRVPKGAVDYRNFEPLLNQDLKDEQALVQPPMVQADQDMMDADSYMPTVLPIRRPGTLAEPQIGSLRDLDADLMHDNVRPTQSLNLKHLAYSLLEVTDTMEFPDVAGKARNLFIRA